MEVYVERNPTHVAAFKVLLAAAGPAQRLIQSPALTHFTINRQAPAILLNDGHGKFASVTEYYLPFLDKGVAWADSGFKNMSHFINPVTSRGIYGWTSAIRECNLYWNRAVRNWRAGNREKAFFYLGAAIHLVQDLCVPHHAMGILLDGHKDYENWVKEKKNNYIIERKGIYKLGNTPEEWIKANSLAAVKFYTMVSSRSSAVNYHNATSILLPRAQKVTAGFLHFFLSKTELMPIESRIC